MSKFVKCSRCGWMHVGVSVADAESRIRVFNEMYSQLTDEQRQEFYNSTHASLKDYEHCVHCGAFHTEMRLATKTELNKSSFLLSRQLPSVLFTC